MVMKLPYLGSSLFLVLTLVSVVAYGSEKRLPILSFDEGYTQLFGDDNLVIHRDGKAVHLSLNERTGLFLFPGFLVLIFFWGYFLCCFSKGRLLLWWWCKTGSGFVSQDLYLHGYFSASIKLPADYTAGVVVAFYVSFICSRFCFEINLFFILLIN